MNLRSLISTRRPVLLAGIALTMSVPLSAADNQFTPAPPGKPEALAASPRAPGTVVGLFATFQQQAPLPSANPVSPPAGRTATPVSSARQTPSVTPATHRWLRSSTSSSSREVAERLLEQATAEYSVGAWASAETSAWEALSWAAEAVEQAAREQGSASSVHVSNAAQANLQIARTAVREARDFGGHYGAVDTDAIRRMVRSHRTAVLDGRPLDSLTAADVIDRYLDEARVRLSGIAANSVEAAKAMDLLAAIYLGRAEPQTLPSSTALCLRRAALQGQPTNASLAMRLGMHLSDLGLYREAQWALEHSLRLAPSAEASQALVTVLQRSGRGEQAAQLIANLQGPSLVRGRPSPPGPRVPVVEQLSPGEFAAISQPVMPASNRGNVITGTLASAKRNLSRAMGGSQQADSIADQNAAESSEPDKRPSLFRRLISPLTGVWKSRSTQSDSQQK